MITFPMISGADIDVFLLVFFCLGVGILSGFTGIGGSFIVMPALIILGLPANFAVGTSLAWVLGNSIIGVFRHGRLGNVDTRLGLVTVVAAISGVEVGVRIINWATSVGLGEEIVLAISICILFTVGVYTLFESIRRKRELDKILEKGEKPAIKRATPLSRKLQSINLPPILHFPKSGINISLWIILSIGFIVGIIVGIIGVGGGFIMVPILVYLIGLPSFMAVGTDLFQIIFSAAYGTIRHTISGNVMIFTSVIMLFASSLGIQFGVLVTRHVRGVSVRLILGISILMSATGAIFKLISILLEKGSVLLQIVSLAATLSAVGLAVVMIVILYIMAKRYKQGHPIPEVMVAFVAKDD